MYSLTPGSNEHFTTSLNPDWDDPHAGLCGLSGPTYPEGELPVSLNEAVLRADDVESMDIAYQNAVMEQAKALGRSATGSQVSLGTAA